MTVTNTPFESRYGFKGPGFSVDDNGNIIANSITLDLVDDNVNTPADFIIGEAGGGFSFKNLDSTNPEITVARGSSYVFELTLETLDFSLFSDDETLLSNGLSHSDGSTGVNAQSKKTGRLVFTVLNSVPETLFYGSSSLAGQFNKINVIDPKGSFDTLIVNSDIQSNSKESGAFVVAGGASIQGNLRVGSELHTTMITSVTNLTIDVDEQITILGNDSSVVGIIGDSGSTIPVTNTTIENTRVGELHPSTAFFTSASVTSRPQEENDVTNKAYVDTTVSALAIALGI